MESTAREHATILMVDDDKNILQVLEARLSFAHYKTLTARSAEEAVEVLAQHPVDLVVSDVKMPGMGGVGLLHEILVQWPHIPVILLTAYGSIPDAVSTIRSGAADYLTKPFDGHQLLQKIATLLGRVHEDEPKRTPTGKGKSVSDVIWGGKSPVMRDFYAVLERVAPTDVAVLILGESGTGKEMVARMLHDLSPRAKGPFVIVDCGSTQPTLLESELFGHVKGAFTHAVRDKKGLMEEAEGGTLFLDEIGNISPEMQTRLLRFLQERTIRRVGDTRAIPVNCRVVAATNADLPALVKKGEFREDLYFRLKVVTLKVPPLRDRKEDIPLLTERFLETFSVDQHRPKVSASPETLRLLMAHTGRATCASCGTRWRAAWCSAPARCLSRAMCRWNRPRTCTRTPRPPRPPPPRPLASPRPPRRVPSLWKKTSTRPSSGPWSARPGSKRPPPTCSASAAGPSITRSKNTISRFPVRTRTNSPPPASPLD